MESNRGDSSSKSLRRRGGGSYTRNAGLCLGCSIWEIMILSRLDELQISNFSATIQRFCFARDSLLTNLYLELHSRNTPDNNCSIFLPDLVLPLFLPYYHTQSHSPRIDCTSLSSTKRILIFPSAPRPSTLVPFSFFARSISRHSERIWTLSTVSTLLLEIVESR